MFGDFEIRELPLSLTATKKKVESFLLSQGLRMENLDRYFGIFDMNDNLVGGGGLQENVVKCIALSESTRNESLTNPLMSRIREAAMADGHYDLLLFTKPENQRIFESLAFHTVGKADKALLLESNPRGISGYCKKLSGILPQSKESRNGVIVMNCNPLTKGHMFLIEAAAKQVDFLFIIPVMEGDSEYSYAERTAMMKAATKDIRNTAVCPGSQYSISQATFPTYFLKDLNDAAKTHIELDLDIFSNHIAPALNASVRFVGTEPLDALTCEYNAVMKRILPSKGIEVVEIERQSLNDIVISASKARTLAETGNASEALKLLPETSVPYLLAHTACLSLKKELEATPKPGLVDRNDNGSHTDMDFSIMSRSIEALKPYFTEFSRLGTDTSLPSHDAVAKAGMEAEKAMKSATGGVNTHRGALFCIGLTTIAAANAYHNTGRIEENGLRDRITRLASGFAGEKDSHGGEARRKYGLKGAAEMAQDAYSELFSEWLPFYRSVKERNDGAILTLLKIMSTLEDTNLYHRGGEEGAAFAKETARDLLKDCKASALEKANADFIARNLSPGGAADMLALTFFIDSVLHIDPEINE